MLMEHFSSLAKRLGLSPSSLSSKSTHMDDQRDLYRCVPVEILVSLRIMGKFATWFYSGLQTFQIA
jgi:hypothetical protein